MTRKPTLQLYNEIADWYADRRGMAKSGSPLMEKKYLDAVISHLPKAGSVLDLGCGIGRPLAEYFYSRGYTVMGVDGAPNMIEKARAFRPEGRWIVADMRTLALGEQFDACLAWDSFFHLTPEEQRPMFPIFRDHLKSGGVLLFTSGPDAGVAIGSMNDQEVYHSSLSTAEYRALLDANGFTVLDHRVEDPECGKHTVWLARKG